MIHIRKTEYPHIIYMEVDGKVTKEDAEKSEAFIQEHFGDKEPLSAVVEIKNIDGVSTGGILKGTLLDIRHWNQFKKFAVLAEESWIKGGAKAVDAAPGIEVEVFKRTEHEKAIQWLLN